MLSECFFLSKRIAENARMRERSVIEANEEDINKKETNAQKINILLTNSLLPQPYTKEIAKHTARYVSMTSILMTKSV